MDVGGPIICEDEQKQKHTLDIKGNLNITKVHTIRKKNACSN
jgi:hypothetical protein